MCHGAKVVAERYLSHLTLDTGHVLRAPRKELDEAVLTIVRQGIDEALYGLSPVIRPGYTLSATQEHGALLATVLTETREPICTIAVACDARQGESLWAALKDPEPGGAIAIGEPPAAPWCAVRLYPGLASHVGALAWLGDFERCVAWAWIDRSTP